MPRKRTPATSIACESDPHWYRDAVIYELHVRAFADSNGDGIGDFGGLLDKLDYLQDLGVTALWLLPFYPSPLRDDGYDIADYTDVHPDYGTLGDFKRFLAAAHARGLKVITELAINHTSNEHPWFQRARRAPSGSRYRNFYVWSDTPNRYREARVIFEDFETSNWAWDSVAGAYYWHRFYSHQPDLNFDSPDVQKAVIKVLDFWMELGVDGMRLDAIPYLFEREGTNCENLPETHAFLKRLRAHVDARFKSRMLLAEANQWPDDAAAYFGDGDECHMNFHFPVMPRLFMSLQLESRFPIVDILRQTPDTPEGCQWALFLRNHDELTLEMVTDEDRDYMYRTYAEDPQMRVNVGIRRRLGPLLGSRRKAELMNGLLMSLPGTPVIYYGDEIGQGDNVYLGDRNGVRTPMQWSGDRNAGFSRANPQKLYLPVIVDPAYHYEAINVEAQQSTPESLLRWTKRLIGLRRQHPVFGRGSIEFLEADNTKVLCFIRSDENERILVVANLSRYMQYVELDLSKYRGMVPVEMSGRTPFPSIGELPYLLTLTGYHFAWFALREARSTTTHPESAELRLVEGVDFAGLWRGPMGQDLERSFREFLSGSRWFGSKARAIKGLQVADQLALTAGDTPMSLLILRVEYDSELPEHYLLPIAFADAESAQEILEQRPGIAVTRLRLVGNGKAPPQEGVLYDPTSTEKFGQRLLALLTRKRTVVGQGTLTTKPSRALRLLLAGEHGSMAPWVPSLEQSNTMVFYGQELAIKLFRHLETGENPDAEMGRFLTRRGFPNVAPVLGTLEYDGPALRKAGAGLVQRFIGGTRNAWDLTLEALQRAFEAALSLQHTDAKPVLPQGDLAEAAQQNVPESVVEVIGAYLPMVRLLGQRTAELHLALASDRDDPAFAPEPFAGHYVRSIVQAARDRLTRVLQLLQKRLGTLPEETRACAEEVIQLRDTLSNELSALLQIKVDVDRIRLHGDYHLGQVLYDGRDFIIIDFEGEPASSISVRRLKRSALTDVCGMLRSFHYASVRALRDEILRSSDCDHLRPYAEMWYRWVAAAFLGSYLEGAGEASFLPRSSEALQALIQLHLLDKCAYELGYELNNRPEWVEVPLVGLRSLAS